MITTLQTIVLILYRYLFITELKLTSNESFYFYYFLLSFLITVAEIPMDIIINNIIECWSGLKMNATADRFKATFNNRSTYWAVDDFSSYANLEVKKEVGITEKLGFSNQFYFIMSLYCLGCVTSLLGLEIVSMYNYNPFSDIFLPLAFVVVSAYWLVIQKLWNFLIKRLKMKEPSDEEKLMSKEELKDKIKKQRSMMKNKQDSFLCELDVLDKYLEKNSMFRIKAEELEKRMKDKGN